MPSVVGLLEQHGLVARRRVDELWEEADRIQAEPAAAEQETSGPRAADARSVPRDAAKPKLQVPMGRQELATVFGMDGVPTQGEALRSKAKHLVARGWLAAAGWPVHPRCGYGRVRRRVMTRIIDQ